VKGSFAGTFTQGPTTPIDFRGRALELPLSSTRMEAMAIAAAIAITPPSTSLTVHTDSQSAVHMMQHIKAPLASRELYRSPDAFFWLHLQAWLQFRDASVSVVWVRGHSGVAGNERVYRLATSAHNQRSPGDSMDDQNASTTWVTLLDPARGQSRSKKTTAPPPRAR
jgi:ribonuclease HI